MALLYHAGMLIPLFFWAVLASVSATPPPSPAPNTAPNTAPPTSPSTSPQSRPYIDPEQARWRPQRAGKDLRLQDFCIFEYGGQTYVASMMKDHANQGITIARSKDLAHWEELGNAVPKRTEPDASMVWAPHVVVDRGTLHMFYTGVSQPKPGHWNQKIMLASTRDPTKPGNWHQNTRARFVVEGREQHWLRPSHDGHVWPADAWADCRDPMVLHRPQDQLWYLFYSGTDTTGGIVGVATAPAVLGPWTDRGAVLQVDKGVPESAFVLKDPAGGFLMVVNHSTPDRKDGGIKIARGRSLLPVDGKAPFGNLEILSESAEPGLAGWAHEFIAQGDGTLLAAYLTGYWVNFESARYTDGKHGRTVGPLRGK